MGYKWCAVPECKNTTIKTPNKLFVTVPRNAEKRKKWLELARRNVNDVKPDTAIFFCEDHFNMETDMTNYYQYKMGFSKLIIMGDEVLPSKFYCQQDRRKRTGTSELEPTRSAFKKRQRLSLVQDCEQLLCIATPSTSATPDRIPKESDDNPEAIEAQQNSEKSTSTDTPTTTDRSIQVHIKNDVHFRSKRVQTKVPTTDSTASPCKHTTASKSTSPFKIYPCNEKPSKVGVIKKLCYHEESDSDISLFDMQRQPQDDSSSFVPTSTKATDSGTSIMPEINEDTENMQSLQTTLRQIVKKPMLYIGIPTESYFLVHLIHKHTNIPHEHILLCLKKIRLNTTFSELADNFGLSLSYSSKIFLKDIPLIASVLRPFIVKLDKYSIKKTMPISFRHNYYNVSCIIDCLEIDIQKPSKALHQALTWSDYKKSNTIKYLISCTPNGLVNYISHGFGGRASDTTIVENCDFLSNLEPGSIIMADRGFKHIEQSLAARGMQLLRPPSVPSGTKLSKQEVRQTKIIASLRIHIERVIRRIREFHMLKQHSVINKNLLRLADDVIVIACALINIQDSLIK